MAKKQLAHLFDATKCIGCQACIVSCVETNYPEMVGRHIEGKNWLASNIRRYTANLAKRPVQLLVQCQHCSEAPCVEACPFGLTTTMKTVWFAMIRSVASAVTTASHRAPTTRVGRTRLRDCPPSAWVAAVWSALKTDCSRPA